MINWSIYPIVRSVIFFCVGILMGHHLSPSLIFPIGISSMLVPLIILGIERTRLDPIIASMLMHGEYILLGILLTLIVQNDRDAFHFSRNITSDDQTIIARLNEDARLGNRYRAECDVLAINGCKTRGKTMVYFKDDSISYVQGNVIKLLGRFSEVPSNTNPDVFDYKGFLAKKRIAHTYWVKPEGHSLMIHDGQNMITSLAYRLRSAALARLAKIFDTRDHLAIASAMILGYKHILSDEQYTVYSETGSIHVLAVSGLHVGVITYLFILLFGRIKSQRTSIKVLKTITLISVVWIFALVTGMAPAVSRAALMFSFFIVGKYWFEEYNIYNILAASALLLLLYDPMLLYQAGFQFSYLALFSIVLIMPLIFTPSILTNYKVLNYIIQLICVSIAAQILVFPVTIYYFHKFPVYFILSGIVAVPAAFLILSIGLAALMLSPIPILGGLLATVLKYIVLTFSNLIHGIHSLPMSVWNGIWLDQWHTGLIYALLFATLLVIFTPHKIRWMYTAGMLVVSIIAYSTYVGYTQQNTTELLVYDMGWKKSMIDVSHGSKKLHTFKSERITQKDIAFNAENHRIRRGLTLSDTLPHHNGYFSIDRDTFLVTGLTEIANKGLITAPNILILNNGSKIKPKNFTHIHTLKTVILDATISKYTVSDWKKFCSEKDITLSSIKEQGAYCMRYPRYE